MRLETVYGKINLYCLRQSVQLNRRRGFDPAPLIKVYPRLFTVTEDYYGVQLLTVRYEEVEEYLRSAQ